MKKLLIYLLLLIPFCGYSQTIINAAGQQQSASSTNTVITQKLSNKGGYYGSVADIAERNAIPSWKRDTGMTVTVRTDSSMYCLGVGKTNSDWYKVKAGTDYTGTQGIIVDGTVIKTGIQTIVLIADSLSSGYTTYHNPSINGYNFTVFDNAINRYLNGAEAVKDSTGFTLQYALTRGDSIVLTTSPKQIGALTSPTINFSQPSNMRVGDADQTLVATSNSAGVISFTSSNTGIFTIVSGNHLHAVAPGTTIVHANQVANGIYSSGTRSRSVSVINQSIAVYDAGNSLTAGVGTEGTSASSTYPSTFVSGHYTYSKALQRRLNTITGGNTYTVTWDGNPGMTSTQFLADMNGRFTALKTWITTNASSYDKLVIITELGTNDEVVGGTSLSQLKANIDSINTQCKRLAPTKVITIGCPLTMRKDGSSGDWPTILTYRNTYNTDITATPNIINADYVADYTTYSYLWSDTAPDNGLVYANPDIDGTSKVHWLGRGALVFAEALAQRIATATSGTLPSQVTINDYQSISGMAIGSFGFPMIGDPDITPTITYSGSTNSESAVTYTSSNPSVATIVANKVHIIGNGTSTITAYQPLSLSFLPAVDTRDINVGGITPTDANFNVVNNIHSTATGLWNKITGDNGGDYLNDGVQTGTSLAANASGYISMDYTTISGNSAADAVYGFRTSNTASGYNGMIVSMFYGPTLSSLENGSSFTVYGVTVMARIFRDGATGVFTLETSMDSGGTWTVIHTYTGTYTGQLWAGAAISGTGNLIWPKTYNFN